MKKRYSVVGYGTFITRKLWINKQNVKVCKVEGYTRILPEGNWFPYVLPDESSEFWALIFEVNEDELHQLDYYEGVPAGLYNRIEISVTLKDGNSKNAFIYIPTEKTIKEQNLTPEVDKKDKWKEEIKKHSEIIERFPELLK